MGGIVAENAVTVVAVRWIGSNAIQLTDRTEGGRIDERLLYRGHELRLTLRQASVAYDFTADGALFKLAAEALRIRMAARFDPMLVVHISDLEPLSHQIEAVYGGAAGADKPDGYPDDRVRNVTESARTLKFETYGFQDH